MQLITAALLAVVSLPAFACSVDRRASLEQARITEGVRTGELTRREAARLEQRELYLRREIARARIDGRVTPAERARIEREENALNRAIYRERHDGQFR
jgi:hypothetical protein